MIFSNEFLQRFIGGQFAMTKNPKVAEFQGEVASIAFDGGILKVEFSWLAWYDTDRDLWFEKKTRAFVLPLSVVGEIPDTSGRITVLSGPEYKLGFIPIGSSHILEKRDIIPINDPDLEALAKELAKLPIADLDRRLKALPFDGGDAVSEVYYAEYRRRGVPLPP